MKSEALDYIDAALVCLKAGRYGAAAFYLELVASVLRGPQGRPPGMA